MRRWMCVVTVLALVGPLTGGAEAAKPKTVWQDGSGDAGNQDSGLPGFTEAGFDLVSGSITRVGDDLEFTVTHQAMPPTGNVPETFRFLWAFAVDGVSYRITFKRADIGKPDLAQNQTTERVGRIDVNGHFRLEGECGQTPAPAVVTFVNCKPLEYVTGRIEPDARSFTVVIPMASVKARPGSRIGPAGGDAIAICQVCWVSHIAERSLQTTIVDSAFTSKTYRVPKKG